MLVLDTHAWWWAISEPTRLSLRATEAINKTPPGQVCVASISLWEFTMMVSRGRVHLRVTPQEWFQHAIDNVGTTVLPLSTTIAIDSCSLPGNFHKDPADRMIVATARIHQVPLITKDRKIRDYLHVQTIW
jgi:PIN domain nuclease of toxin-antitoxin system